MSFNSMFVCLIVACDLKSLVCHVSPLPQSHFEPFATLDAAGSFTSIPLDSRREVGGLNVGVLFESSLTKRMMAGKLFEAAQRRRVRCVRRLFWLVSEQDRR